MDLQYKLIISNRRMCKEFTVPGSMSEAMLGTTVDCTFRLNQENFFEKIQIALTKRDDQWQAICSDGVYFNLGDSKKLMVTKLNHGDVISLRYEESGNEVFQIRFVIDFEYKIPFYNWYVDLSSAAGVSISDASNSTIRILEPLETNVCAELTNVRGKYVVKNRQSRFGTYVNGKLLSDAHKLSDCEFISVAGASFYYREGRLYFDMSDVAIRGMEVHVVQKKSRFAYPKFVRNTRRKQQPKEDVIKILDPSQKPSKPEMNIVTSLMPSLAMFALVVVLRGIMSTSGGTYIIFSICSMGLGIVTTIVSLVQNQKKYKKQLKERTDTYNAYIAKKREEISKARAEEQELSEKMFKTPEQEFQKIMDFDSDIFDRIPDDEDFLYVYLGQGRVEAKRVVDYKEQEKLSEDDEMALIPAQVAEEYKYIESMPVTADFRKANAVGIVGSAQDRLGLFRNIICDLSARQYHTDTDIYVLVKDEIKECDWLKLLPQLNKETFARNIVFNDATKTNVFEGLFKELTFRSENPGNHTHIIVFALNSHNIASHPLSKFIPRASELNATFVFFEDMVDYLPLHCSTIVECEAERGQVYKCENDEEKQAFTYKPLSYQNMMDLSLKMAAIYCEEISLESSLRKNISMFELLEIYAASDLDLNNRWNSSRIYESMAAPLGVNSKDEIVYLNLHEKFHGPHGLVAGTTGSGKSEILQSYILSAATLFHPYEIGFVIIDFKGGGMVNQFANLPHLIGAITNIDGREIDRSLKSIKAELIKRQELFAEANVNHIDKYIRAFKEGKVSTALPHLVIIVDEFAELKAEQPEFMKELISAARIGRSLGVHLILATQKPAGQVNEQIWSNSKFKLCLKVQDQEDSKEVIKSPLAAEIKEPGRAYLQVGNNEIFELFQSAYSGAPAVHDEESAMKKFKLYTMGLSGREKILFETKKTESKAAATELEAIVEFINNYCENNSIKRLPNICLPSLPDVINYKSAKTKIDKMLQVVLGEYDDPDHQYQGELVSNIGIENTIIAGGSQTGKTNLLQLCIRQLAESNTPEQVAIYILDFGSMVLKNFEKLKHVGGVVLASDDEKLKNLFKLLAGEIESRKAKLLKAGVSSFAAYLEGGFTDMPKVYLMLDNFNAFKELYLEKYEQDFVRLCRDGISFGISVIMTNASATGIGYKHMSNFSNRICLPCNNKGDYSSFLEHCRIEPKNVPGRVLFMQDKEIYEGQTYLAFDGEKEIDRAKAVKDFVDEINAKYADSANARMIPSIPDVLDWKLFNEQFASSWDKHAVPVGLDFATIEPMYFDFTEDAEIAVVSKKKQSALDMTSRLLGTIMKNCFTKQFNIFIVDSVEQGLKEYRDNPFVAGYSIDPSETELMLDAIRAQLEANRAKILSEGTQTDMPYSLLILNSKEAIEYVSATKPVFEKYKDMVENYKNCGLLVILGCVDNAAIAYNAPELLKRVKESRKVIIVDPLATVKIFDLPSSIVRNYNKPLLEDEGYYVLGQDINKIKFMS